jgi:DNA-binding NtrC family response regulator
VPRFTEAALRIIAGYYWPGNVRELENFVQRIVVMSERECVDITDLPAHMRFSAARESGLNRTLAEVEAEHIRNVLASVDGNKTRAAEILGIDRKTLRDKLKKLDGPPPKVSAE